MNADDHQGHSITRSLDHSITSRVPDHWTTRPRATLLKLLVKLYRNTIGVTLPNSCRYQPTCSQYALDALTEYGAVRGTWLALKRIARCHPLAAGGYDPVRKVTICPGGPVAQYRNRISESTTRPPDHSTTFR